MLSTVAIRGYRSLRDLVLPLRGLTVITGANGSGKSSTYRALRLGYKVEEVPILFVDRRVGQSKMSRKIFVEALGMVWKLRLGIK